MSRFWKHLAIALVFLASGYAFAAESEDSGVLIKQVPLTYKDIALKDGHELYDHLCAVCHGFTGKGDGPAAPELSNPVPDLTQFGVEHGGKYHTQLKRVISGTDRTVHKDVVGMPLWFTEFQYVRRNKFGHPRTTYANLKINSLVEYVEELALAQSD